MCCGTRIFLATQIIGIVLLTLPNALGSQDFTEILDADYSLLSRPVTAGWENDPFRGGAGYASSPPEPEEKYALSAIAWSKRNPMAMINGSAVTIGDSVGTRQVIEIGPNFVLLQKGNSTLELALPIAKRSDEVSPPSAQQRAPGGTRSEDPEGDDDDNEE